VLHVLYLVFNEGYTSSGGAALHRADLSDEAIRLARAVHALLPGETEVAGLLALMLLTDARRAARTDASGAIVPLPKQDRALWNRAAIEEGLALVAAALPKGRIGPYQIQAAIAALHDEAARAEDTDWPQILALYSVLLRLSDNPMIALNHAVAAAMVHGPRAGLALVDAIAREGKLAGTHRVDAVRAHLLELAGANESAIASYLAAAGRTASVPERNYLATQAARLRGADSSSDA
jgi:predicted RNA polymerase sigma factor